MAIFLLNADTLLFILAFIWSLALIIILARKIPSLGPLSVIAAIILSTYLIFTPRESQFSSAEEQSVMYGYSIIYRSSLLAVMGLLVVIGFALSFVHRTMAPVPAQPPRSGTGRKVPHTRHIGECVICVEETFMVQIFPCLHSTMCQRCIMEVLINGSGVCPLCRRPIIGYSQVF